MKMMMYINVSAINCGYVMLEMNIYLCFNFLRIGDLPVLENIGLNAKVCIETPLNFIDVLIFHINNKNSCKKLTNVKKRGNKFGR